jgi:ABC-type transport system involved in multi-copper enzyme maturation permease subunit
MAAASPFVALVKREFITFLRRPRATVFLLVFMAPIAGLMVASWPRGDMPLAYAGVRSNALYSQIMYLITVACYVLLPGLAATAIVEEKTNGTWDQLRLTLISPGSVFFGKLVTVIGFMLLLVVAILPVLASVLFLVGVDWVMLLQSFAGVIWIAVFCSVIGMMCSVLYQRRTSAVTSSYLLVGVASLLAMVTQLWWRWAPKWGAWFAAGLPLPPLFVNQGLIVLLCGLIAIAMLRRIPSEERSDTGKPVETAAQRRQRRRRFPFYLLDPLERKSLIADENNPVYVREVRWGPSGRPGTLIRTFYITLLLFIGFDFLVGITTVSLYSSPETADPTSVGAIMVFQMIVMAFLAPASTAGAFAREREADTFDLLRLTFLSPSRLVMGKFRAGLFRVYPAIVTSLIGGLFYVAYFSPLLQSVEYLILGYISLAAGLVAALSLGLFASVISRRTSNATLLSYGLTFLLFAGATIGLQIVFTIADISQADDLFYVTAFFSPILTYGVLVESPYHAPAGLFVYWGSNIVATTALSFGVIAYSIWRVRNRLMVEE